MDTTKEYCWRPFFGLYEKDFDYLKTKEDTHVGLFLDERIHSYYWY